MVGRPPNRDNGTVTLFIRNVPESVKNFFKSHCAARGITMRKKLIQLMRDTVEQEGRKKK